MICHLLYVLPSEGSAACDLRDTVMDLAPMSSNAAGVLGAEMLPAAMDEDVAPSPKSLTSRHTRSMVSPGIKFASVRKTPKNLRNSLLLSRMSPEEG